MPRLPAAVLRIVPLAISFALSVTIGFGQGTLYVNGGSGSDVGACTADPCATISYAIGQAGSGYTIQIADGVYTETLTIEKSLNLYGQSEEGTIVQAHHVPGEATGRVVTIAGAGGMEVEIANLTIRYGVATGSGFDGGGGGLFSEETALTLTSVTFTQNTAAVGGGMVDQLGNLTLTNVTFTQNEAIEVNSLGGGGGGMYNFNNSVNLSGVTFTGNHADVQGGAVFNQINTGSFEDINLTQNTSNGYGGGVYNWGASASFVNVSIYGSYAPWGAGMYNIGSSNLILTGVVFTENGGGIYGGGMYNNAAGTVDITDVFFVGNVAGYGGGVYNENTSPIFNDVHFTGNSAGFNGGGIFNAVNSSPSFSDVTFTGNSVSANNGQGGGMYNAGASTSLTQVVFSENSAMGGNGCGGGMATTGSSVTFTEVTFSENTARAGGGLCNTGGSPMLVDVTFDSNHANSGGGMYGGANTTPELVNVMFTGNSAISGTVGSGGGYGGGMYNSNSSPTLSDVTFTGNVAEEGGGGMQNVSGSPELENVTFAGNSAIGSSLSTRGGGMGNSSGSTPILIEVMFTENESAGSGGGMANINNSAPTLKDVTFIGNIASGGAGHSGGGMWNSNSSPTLTNVVFRENTAYGGGGMRLSGDGSQATLTNVAFVDNYTSVSNGGGLDISAGNAILTNATLSNNASARNGGGIHIESGGSAVLLNTIIWGNSAEGFGSSSSPGHQVFTSGSNSTIEIIYSLYSDENGDIAGNGTVEIETSLIDDPLFVDAESGDFRLQEESPAVNTGDPDTDLALFPGGPQNPLDLDNNPRVRDGQIDIGAYEWQGGSGLPPENDAIANAIVISTEDATYEGTNVDATLEEGEPEPSCTFDDWTTNFSVWWTFTAEENGLVSIDTNGSLTLEGDDLDTVLSLHNAADLSEVACDDDSGEGPQSLIEDAAIVEGESYLIRVAGYNESAFSQGTIQLTVAFQFGVDNEGGPDEIVQGLTPPSPNPVRERAALTVSVERQQRVIVEVFDLMGRRVQLLHEDVLLAGTARTLTLDAQRLSSGMYLVRARGEDFTETHRVTVVR